jgi:hypothetical protein
MQYRSEVISVTGFVQQIACSFLRHGYWWYVTGCVPAGKDARSVDRKLVEKYGIAMSESTRARRKQLGFANLQYIRHERFFAILATNGQNHFFDEEAAGLRDIRRIPPQFAGYSISYRRGGRTRDGKPDHRWNAHVEIERGRFLEVKAHFLHLAVHRSPANMAMAFCDFPFEPYAPVRRQLLVLLREVNAVRRQAGFQVLPIEVLPLRRRIVKPFADLIGESPKPIEPRASAPDKSGLCQLWAAGIGHVLDDSRRA